MPRHLRRYREEPSGSSAPSNIARPTLRNVRCSWEPAKSCVPGTRLRRRKSFTFFPGTLNLLRSHRHQTQSDWFGHSFNLPSHNVALDISQASILFKVEGEILMLVHSQPTPSPVSRVAFVVYSWIFMVVTHFAVMVASSFISLAQFYLASALTGNLSRCCTFCISSRRLTDGNASVYY